MGMQVGIDATVEFLNESCLVPSVPQNYFVAHISMHAQNMCLHGQINPIRTSEEADNQLMNAFLHGELMLNLNVPPNWNGSYQTTRLGMRWYRDAVQFVDGNDGSVESTFTIGAAYIDNHVVGKGDVDCVETGVASISSLPTWPQTHPLALDDALLAHALSHDENGHPTWFKG